MSVMTKTEYAKHRRVSQPAISKMIREDRILITLDGMVDVEVSDMMLDQYSESPLQNPQTDDHAVETLLGDDSYAVQRAKLTRYKAELAKIDYDRASGNVVDAEQVRSDAHTTARRVRDSILNLPDRLAPMLAAETDIHTVRTLLDGELRKALEELHNQFMAQNQEGTTH